MNIPVETLRATSLHQNTCQTYHPNLDHYQQLSVPTNPRLPVPFANTTTQYLQSRFFDHVIRIENSMANIQNYIIQNPANWKQDKNKIETIFMTNLSILTDSK